MKFNKHQIILIVICFSLYLSFNMAVYSKDDSASLYQKFLKSVDKVNKTGDKNILKVSDSLQSLDTIYDTLNKYYQKTAKKNPDPNIVSLLQLTQSRRGLAYAKLKSAEKAIKEFQKNDKKGQGDLDQLRTDLEPMILNFNDYKTSLSSLIDAIQAYHDSHQNSSKNSTQTPKPTQTGQEQSNNNSE